MLKSYDVSGGDEGSDGGSGDGNSVDDGDSEVMWIRAMANITFL